MPCNYKRYPADWKTVIRPRILKRAGHRCEGSPAYPDCRAFNHVLHPVTRSKVVLTIAHLNHDTTDNRDENLRAWCQRCHLTYDAVYHAANRKVKKERKELWQQPKLI